jgi:hypothetical protein
MDTETALSIDQDVGTAILSHSGSAIAACAATTVTSPRACSGGVSAMVQGHDLIPGIGSRRRCSVTVDVIMRTAAPSVGATSAVGDRAVPWRRCVRVDTARRNQSVHACRQRSQQEVKVSSCASASHVGQRGKPGRTSTGLGIRSSRTRTA